MGVLEIIAERQLGSLFKSKPGLKRSLAKLEAGRGKLLSKKEAEAEKERISAIVQLCFEYERETDAGERENILRTLEEIAANDPVKVPTSSLEDFEADLVSADSTYTATDRTEREKTKRFLKTYFSLKTKAGLSTQEDVAKKSGLARSYVAVIESGERKPQHKTLQKLARAFRVDVSELI